MIRINLVAGDRRATKSASRSLQIEQKITLIGSVLLIVTGLLIGWRYWSLTQEQARLAAELESARREETRLTQVLREVADLETRRATLQQRKTLIDELRKGQTAPVHMIDQVSRALPEMTWLTSLKQEGYEVTVEGMCQSLTALSDFVANLEAARYFKRPVEIIDSAVVTQAGRGQDNTENAELIRFAVKGTFQMAGIEVAPPPTKSARPAKGGR